LAQTCEDVLLAHWRVPLETIRPQVPAALEVEQHGGSAWLGIVAFRAVSVRLRGLLPVPGLSSFLQLNVRTYVRAADGIPGIWFFGLDVSNRLVAEAARRVSGLPFFRARITAARSGDWIGFDCARCDERGRVFNGRYRAAGELSPAEPGSLEAFLTDRYCAYAPGERGALRRAEVHHAPWALQEADAEIELATIAPIELAGAPIGHFARRQDMVLWLPEPVR
jgi:uncharacterized protein YqjF (DUF2071 family)